MVVFVGEVDSTGLIDCDTHREADFRSQRWPLVAAEPVCPISSDRIDQARQRVNPPYSVIDRIRDVKIPAKIQCHLRGIVQGRTPGRSAIAAESALANRYVKGWYSRWAGTRPRDGSHYTCRRYYHPHAGVLVVGNVEVPVPVDR